MKPRLPLHRLPLLTPGTRVQRITGGLLGVVQTYRPEDSSGCFPVKWDDPLWSIDGSRWEMVGFDDVLVVRRQGTRTAAA